MKDGAFDLAALDDDWTKHKAEMQVRMIAAEKMGITDLAQHPELQRALMDAYQLGKQT